MVVEATSWSPQSPLRVPDCMSFLDGEGRFYGDCNVRYIDMLKTFYHRNPSKMRNLMRFSLSELPEKIRDHELSLKVTE